MAKITLRGGPMDGQTVEWPGVAWAAPVSDKDGVLLGNYNRKNMMGIASSIVATWEPIDADR